MKNTGQGERMAAHEPGLGLVPTHICNLMSSRDAVNKINTCGRIRCSNLTCEVEQSTDIQYTHEKLHYFATILLFAIYGEHTGAPTVLGHGNPHHEATCTVFVLMLMSEKVC